MKAAIAISMLAACGHAAPAPARVLANSPSPIDAAPPDADDDAGGDDGVACTSGTEAPMHVGGADGGAHLDECTDTVGEEHGDMTIYNARIELVVTHGDARETLEIAEWQKGWEDGMGGTLVGVLAAPNHDDVVLVSTSAWGTGDGLEAVSATLTAYAVQGGALVKIRDLQAAVIDATVATDGSHATIETCDAPAQGVGTGGGACDAGAAHYDGDGKTIEWRWTGKAIRETAVTP
jgi:hypothetical protein